MSFLDPHASSPKAEQRGRFSWRTLPRVCLIAVFRGYQLLISPLFPPVCRYIPSCSQYAIEAVSRHGVLRGGAMAIWRILRCHPFARGGYDPVK